MIPVRLFLLFCAKLEAIYDWVCPCQVGEPDLVFSRSHHLKLEVRCGEINYPDSARLSPQCTDDSGQFNNCRIRNSSVHSILVLVTKNLDGDVSETKRSTRDPQVANDRNFGAVSDYLLWSHVPKGAKDEVGLRRGPLTSSSPWKFVWHQPAFSKLELTWSRNQNAETWTFLTRMQWDTACSQWLPGKNDTGRCKTGCNCHVAPLLSPVLIRY